MGVPERFRHAVVQRDAGSDDKVDAGCQFIGTLPGWEAPDQVITQYEGELALVGITLLYISNGIYGIRDTTSPQFAIIHDQPPIIRHSRRQHAKA